MTPAEALEILAEEHPEARLADGFETALIGIASVFTNPPIAVYDYAECVSILMKRDGMDEEEAEEFMQFNVVGAYVGEGTPAFLRAVTR